MRKEYFAHSLERLEELQEEFNLEDCGMSGAHVGYHWLCDNENNVDVYFKITE